MQEYRSPFLLPEAEQCSNPEHHQIWPYMHRELPENRSDENEWGRECPVHSVRAREWRDWAKWREKYATLEPGTPPQAAQAVLESCLTFVTGTCPPDAAPPRPPRPRKPLYADPWYWTGAAAAVLLLVLLSICS